MYFPRTPYLAKLIYPGLTWRVNDPDKNIYLTFDDGPDPAVTPEVLDILDQFQAKATFFCVGEKVVQHPEIFASLLAKGHTVGNHSFNHLNGKKTPLAEYISNVQKAKDVIESELFRPPYGSITARQARKLGKSYTIIMWTVLPGDFDNTLSREEVLKRAIRNTQKGSIIVFHDNIKFHDKMIYALKGFITHFNDAGYRFKAITSETI